MSNTNDTSRTLTGIRGAAGDVARVTNGGLDVNIQDQHTPVLIQHFTKTFTQTSLTTDVSIEDVVIYVDSSVGVVPEQHVSIYNPSLGRFYFGEVVSVSDTVVLDTPLDFAFPADSSIDFGNHGLNVNGSSTTQIFGIRGDGLSPGVDVEFDVTRIIFEIKTDTAVDLSTFGDIAALTNGLVFRRRDNNGGYRNIFNVKSNGDISGISFDVTFRESTNPTQGQDGLIARLTFAGQNKMGVTIRIGEGEDLEFLVRDNLTTLEKFHVIVEGHIVE